MITYLSPSAEAVINDQLSEKCKNHVQCRWIKTKNYITTFILHEKFLQSDWLRNGNYKPFAGSSINK